MAAMFAWAIHWRVIGGLVAAVLLSVDDLLTRHYLSRDHLRQPVPAPDRRPDRRPDGRLPAALGGPHGGRRAGGSRGARSAPGSPARCTTGCSRCSPSCSAGDRTSGPTACRAGPTRRRAGAGAARADPPAGRGRPDARAWSTWSVPCRRSSDAPASRWRRPRAAYSSPKAVADEIVAVVSACLDNVVAHVGPAAPAWVLLEATPDAVRGDRPRRGAGHRHRVGSRRPSGEGRLGVVVVDPGPGGRPRRHGAS